MTVQAATGTSRLDHRDVVLIQRTDHSPSQHRNMTLAHGFNLSKKSSKKDILPDVGFMGRVIDELLDRHDADGP